MDKITHCQECGKEIGYKTKKPILCKECHDKKYGTRKFYRKPKIPTKSKGEYVLNKVLNEMFLNIPCIDGGYYSFLPSPKGYPMQLDRYYPRLHLAFEFNGKQHVEDSAYFYQKKEEHDYQQECDKLKKELCEKSNIKIIYINHDEFVCRELIVKKLIEANMYDNVQAYISVKTS